MIKLLTIAALAALVAAPAFAQTVPLNTVVITAPVFVQTIPPAGDIGAGPLLVEPVLPGTSTVPGTVFLNSAQKSLDTTSATNRERTGGAQCRRCEKKPSKVAKVKEEEIEVS
jgi:hypothetical protein